MDSQSWTGHGLLVILRFQSELASQRKREIRAPLALFLLPVPTAEPCRSHPGHGVSLHCGVGERTKPAILGMGESQKSDPGDQDAPPTTPTDVLGLTISTCSKLRAGSGQRGRDRTADSASPTTRGWRNRGPRPKDSGQAEGTAAAQLAGLPGMARL